MKKESDLQEHPLVSIVIPVYNGENYLKDAIDSALTQTYKEIEVIVVDDGSTDRTEEIAQSYGNRIRYFKKENGGVASAVNYGVKKMRGEYFSWLSHDDFFYPDKIEKQIDALLASGQRNTVCFSNIDVLYVERNETVHEDYLQYYVETQITNSCFAPVFFTVHGSTIVVHKAIFKEIGLWDETLKATQDSVWLFHAMRGKRSVFVKEPLVTVRIHDAMGQRTMKSHADEFNQMVIHFCEELSKNEKVILYGSEYNFYYRLYRMLDGRDKATYCMDYLREKLTVLTKEIIDITPYYKMCFGSEKLQIAIFGMGKLGRIVYDAFEENYVKIDCFFDNNVLKIGQQYRGCACREIEELKLNPDDYIVIVSVNDPWDILKQLNEMGISHVTVNAEAAGLLYKIAAHYND